MDRHDRSTGRRVAERNLRRTLLLVLPALVAGTALNAAGCAAAYDRPSSWVSGGIAAVEIVDRTTGEHLPAFTSWAGATRGNHFVVGAPGHEYQLRIRNLTGGRILAVGSVDGVNVVSGETAAASQQGYVIGPWQSVEINGWRTSLANTSSFFFTEQGASYAARTGRPDDVGVIGVAVFRERRSSTPPQVIGQARDREPMPMRKSEAPGDAAASRDASRPQASGGVARMEERAPAAAAPAPSLGTGYGRNEDSRATRVAFERATSTPAEVLSVRYDSYANLVAMGVLPRTIARAPDPFPGGFVQPPPN